MSAFETLIREKNAYRRWYPVSVEAHRASLKLDWSVENGRQAVNNICYNLQYLEYMQLQLNELRLSSVLEIMLCKNIVTTCISILEAILENLLLSAGYLDASSHAPALAMMIKMMKRHPELLDVSREDLKAMDSLRKLRNKVHLQNSSGGLDHDYFNFDRAKAEEAMALLNRVLAAPQVSQTPGLYHFLP